jgi:hypothetical protein
MEQQKIPLGQACGVLLFMGAQIGMFVYCIVLGTRYPTDGGCTSLDNGNLPNQSGLDFAWWFEVYGAVGLSAYLIAVCGGICVTANDGGSEGGGGPLQLCSLPLQCTQLVFFIIGNVWFFYFTPKTTFSNEAGSSNRMLRSLASTPSSSFTHSDIITDGIHAANCEWLGENGFYMLIVQWLSIFILCILMCLCSIICIPFQSN